MKVVFEQAVGVSFGDLGDVPGVKIEEIGVIAFFSENIFAIISPIVNMVEDAGAEFGFQDALLGIQTWDHET